MIIPSIVAMVSLYVFIKFLKNFFDDGDKIFAYSVFIGMSCICFLVSAWLFAIIVHKDHFIVEYNQTPIVALADVSEVAGDLFILTGHIGQEEYYKFYIGRVDGGKIFKKVSAKNTIIYEEDRTDGYISNAKIKAKYADWVYLFLIPKFLSDDKPGIYAIHVPKGTIRNGFSIDMK